LASELEAFEQPLLMFAALVAIYNPVASVSSYFPTVGRLRPTDQMRLALGLFAYVTLFALTALWLGEPLLKLLGVSTAALTATGGIALASVGVPLMLGRATAIAEVREEASLSWRTVLFMPTTFPLTVGGTTFAMLVSFRSQAEGFVEVAKLSAAGIVYAAVTGVTVYVSGHLERRISDRTRAMLERIAGILLTSVAVTLVIKGATPLVQQALARGGP
jgi:multiple antibiotic resistance protein